MQKPQSVSGGTHEGPGTRPQTYRYDVKYRGVAAAVSVLGSGALAQPVGHQATVDLDRKIPVAVWGVRTVIAGIELDIGTCRSPPEARQIDFFVGRWPGADKLIRMSLLDRQRFGELWQAQYPMAVRVSAGS